MMTTAPALPPFWRLVENHADELLRHARRLVGDEAEDVVQDALLKALRGYDRLPRTDHLRAWLYRITTPTAFDHGSRRVRRGEVLMDEVPGASVEEDYDDGRFEALIEPLPDGAKRVLIMRFVRDLSYQEIADELRCSQVAARQRVSSAVRTLRQKGTPT
ncbi:MAG: RNA polymerase sigma factor [Actinomycetota bacterium]